jgi:hypothetical protein
MGPVMETDTLKLVYCTYFHFVMSYRVWGNSTHSKQVSNIQKKIVRLLAGIKKTLSCKHLFQKLNILPLATLWATWKCFQQILHTHDTQSRHKYDLHMLNAMLTGYQKGAYYTGIKLFSNLSSSILNYKIVS